MKEGETKRGGKSGTPGYTGGEKSFYPLFEIVRK